MSPYLLLGFLLAGLMHVFIPGGWYSKYLAAGSLKSVVYAALFGVPLPLCSCGVIPTAMSLRREGASRGATVSFLIATPQTGVDSIIATYSLMGLPFAIIRPIVALITAVLGGSLVNLASPEVGVVKTPIGGSDNSPYRGFFAKLREAFSYAYVEMMGDIGKWLVVGLVVAGLITTCVPDSYFEVFKDNSLLSMLLVLCIAIPMYICATGSIPIAVALMMKGLTPGAGLVLLMAGPACNLASILVVGKVLGRRTLITYLVSIVLGSVVFGLMIDQFLPREWFMQGLVGSHGCCAEEQVEWFGMLCTGVLALLLINALVRNRLHGHQHHHDHATLEAAASEEDNVQVFRVEGMDCSHCAQNAAKALRSVEGVEQVEVDLASATARVVGDASFADLAEAVGSLGFKAVR